MPIQFAIMAVDRAAFSDAEVRTHFLDGVEAILAERKSYTCRLAGLRRAHHLSPGGFQRPGSVLGFAEEVRETGEGVEGDRRSRVLHGHPADDG